MKLKIGNRVQYIEKHGSMALRYPFLSEEKGRVLALGSTYAFKGYGVILVKYLQGNVWLSSRNLSKLQNFEIQWNYE